MNCRVASLEEQTPLLALTATGVVKHYQKANQPALADFNLEISRGEFFGLLGPNGAGKTTALSILCGLLAPDRGSVAVHGLSYRDDPYAIKKEIGIVPQEIALYDDLSAAENLGYWGGAHRMIRAVRVEPMQALREE